MRAGGDPSSLGTRVQDGQPALTIPARTGSVHFPSTFVYEGSKLGFLIEDLLHERGAYLEILGAIVVAMEHDNTDRRALQHAITNSLVPDLQRILEEELSRSIAGSVAAAPSSNPSDTSNACGTSGMMMETVSVDARAKSAGERAIQAYVAARGRWKLFTDAFFGRSQDAYVGSQVYAFTNFDLLLPWQRAYTSCPGYHVLPLRKLASRAITGNTHQDPFHALTEGAHWRFQWVTMTNFTDFLLTSPKVARDRMIANGGTCPFKLNDYYSPTDRPQHARPESSLSYFATPVDRNVTPLPRN